MDIFKITKFSSASNPEPQAAGHLSAIAEYYDSVDITVGDVPEGGSIYAREKYRLTTQYKTGDNFYIWEDLELPANFYDRQNGSMRLIALWHNTNRGRLGLWIDSKQTPRLQIERKDGALRQLWIGAPRQIPTGRHQIALHIILGSLIGLYVDGVLIGNFKGDNLPYAGYTANQVLFFIDGANAQTKVISGIIGYEIGADVVAPFVPVNPCADLEFQLAVAKVARQNAERKEMETYAAYQLAQIAASDARIAEAQAQAAVNTCKGL